MMQIDFQSVYDGKRRFSSRWLVSQTMRCDAVIISFINGQNFHYMPTTVGSTLGYDITGFD